MKNIMKSVAKQFSNNVQFSTQFEGNVYSKIDQNSNN